MSTLSAALRSSNIEVGIKGWVKSPIEDPLLELDRASEAFSGKLPENLKAKAEQLQREAECFLARTNPHSQESYLMFQKLFNFTIPVLETIFDLFDVKSLFFKSDYDCLDDYKPNRTVDLISFVVMLITTGLSLVGIKKTRKKFSVVFTAILVRSLIYPYFQPPPRTLPKGLNLSQAMRRGEIETMDGDEKTLSQIAEAIERQTVVLLVGSSEVDKTETAKAFVKAIEDGRYPTLRKLTAFHFYIPDITDGSGANLFGRIKVLVGRNSNRILFIWNKFQNISHSHLADQMKTHFDPVPRGQPFVMAITTDKEIDTFKKNHGALLERVTRIEVLPCDDKRALKLLPSLLLKKMPEALVLDPQETFEYLITQCREKLPSERFTPYHVHIALEVLNRCLEFIGESQPIKGDEGPIADRFETQSELSLKTVGSVSSIFSTQTGGQSRPLCEHRISSVERECEVKALFLKRRQLLAIKKHFYQTALKIAQSQKPLRSDLVKFHLIGSYVERLMQEAVVEEGKRLSVKTVMDKGVIDQVIEEIIKERTAANGA